MYEFVPIYKEDGELFEDIIVKIINNKIKYEFEDYSGMQAASVV